MTRNPHYCALMVRLCSKAGALRLLAVIVINAAMIGLASAGLVAAQEPVQPEHIAAIQWSTPQFVAVGRDTWHEVSSDGARVAALNRDSGVGENEKPVRFFTRNAGGWDTPLTIANNGVDQTPSGSDIVWLPQYTHPVLNGDGTVLAYLGHTGAGYAVYLSEWTDGPGWSAPVAVPTDVANPHYRIDISADGNTLAYSDYVLFDTARLHVLTRAGGTWGVPVEVSDPVLGGAHPTLSADGRQLAFISNTRLVFTEFAGGHWTLPKTLSPVAWPGKDIRVDNPQISADGRSIFFWGVQLIAGTEPGRQILASQDLYVVRRLGTSWTEAAKVTATPTLPVHDVDAPAAINDSGTRVVYSRPITETDPWWGYDVVIGSYLEQTEFVDGAWTPPTALTTAPSYGCHHHSPRLSDDGKRVIYAGCSTEGGEVAFGLSEMVTTVAPPAPAFPVITGTIQPDTTTTFCAGPVVFTFAPGVFTDTVTLTYTVPTTAPPHDNQVMAGPAFSVTAVSSSTGQSAQPAPGQVYTVTIGYAADGGSAIENTLSLMWWNGAQWTQTGITGMLDPANDTLVAEIGHFSLFAVWGNTNHVYLPLVVR